MEKATVIYNGIIKPEEEIQRYTKFIKEHPNTTELYEGRALTYITNKEYEKALADFQKAFELDTHNTHYLFCCADCFGKLGKWDDALKEYKKILKIDDKDTYAYKGIADILSMQNNNEEAEKYYSKAIEIKPSVENYLFRAYFYQNIGKYAEAIEDYDNCLKIDPKDENVISLREQVLEKNMSNIKFEDIHKMQKKFIKLQDSLESIEEYIEKGIEWDKVVWGRPLLDDENKKYFVIRQQKARHGKTLFYVIDKNTRKLHDKKTLANTYDLYDKDGKLLNIAILGF